MVQRMRTVLYGSLGPGASEDWSVSLYWRLSAGGASQSQTDIEELAGSVYNEFGTNTVLMGWLGTGSTLSGVTAYSYDTTGPATVSATVTGSIGGTGTIVLPPQCTQVISLLTGSPGKSRRGRVYWPNLTKPVATDLKIGSSTATALVTNFRDAVNGVDIGGITPVDLVVYSPTLDALTDVSTVRVGNVVDTQRRRRDRLTETYQSTSL